MVEQPRRQQSDKLKESWKRDPLRRIAYAEIFKARNADPEFREKREAGRRNFGTKEKRSESMKKAHSNPEYRAKQAKITKSMWQDPEYRAKQEAINRKRWQDPAFRAKHSAGLKAQWANAEAKEAMSLRVKKFWADPEHRKEQTERLIKRWSDPAARQQLSDTQKETWKRDPQRRKVYKEQFEAKLADPEIRNKQRIGLQKYWDERLPLIMKSRWADPQYRAKQEAINRARWQDPAYRAKQQARLEASWANGTRKRAEPKTVMSPEERAALSSMRMKKLWANPEFKEQQRRKAIARQADPDVQRRQSDAMKASWRKRKSGTV